MKNMIRLMFVLLMLLLFPSCSREDTVIKKELAVFVEEGSGYRVQHNGAKVMPGNSTTFTIYTETGYSITGLDYPGPYSLRSSQDNVYYLTVSDVQYPSRIRLDTACSVRRITYDANGGALAEDGTELQYTSKDGSTYLFVYDVTEQLRPNTERGTDLFVRNGHTLVSWNTRPDGTGDRIGLGSRITVPVEGITLYAQWAEWAPDADFTYKIDENYRFSIDADGNTTRVPAEGWHITITGYKGDAETLVIPETISSLPVKEIASYAFLRCSADTVILPKGLQTVQENAFYAAALTNLVLFDDIESIPDKAFTACRSLTTLSVNVVEVHYGYYYRRESVLANKVDMLINNRGTRKMVFYAGCSMWYNLDGPAMQEAVGDGYKVINMGLNGVSSSIVQMEILIPYLEEGDIFFHTPEVSSPQQLLTYRDMSKYDDKIWAGVEYNYDLFRNVNIRMMDGVFDSLSLYLSKKKEVNPPYRTNYSDKNGFSYMDETGSIDFPRTVTSEELVDSVDLDTQEFVNADLSYLEDKYKEIAKKGVRIYISCAVVNMDYVPGEHQGNLDTINYEFRKRMSALSGVSAVISDMHDYVYRTPDMYDTNYHMLSATQVANTKYWIRDLLRQMEKDGLR